MLPLRYTQRWRAAGFLLLLLVLVATLMPAFWLLDNSKEFVTWFMDIDKWLHTLTFMFLAVWFAGQYARRSRSSALRLPAWAWAVGACGPKTG